MELKRKHVHIYSFGYISYEKIYRKFREFEVLKTKVKQ